MKCTICGAEIPEGLTACSICGTPVAGAPSTQTTGSSTGLRLAPTPVPTADSQAQPQNTGYEANTPYNTYSGYSGVNNGVYHGYNSNLPLDRKNNFPTYEMEAGQPLDVKQFFKQRCTFEVQKQIKSAYWICYILGGLLLLLGFYIAANPSAFIFRSGDTAYYLDENKLIVYGVAGIACGIGVHMLLSRIAACALIAISVILAIMNVAQGARIGFMGYLMIAAGVYATMGTFSFWKQYDAYKMSGGR